MKFVYDHENITIQREPHDSDPEWCLLNANLEAVKNMLRLFRVASVTERLAPAPAVRPEPPEVEEMSVSPSGVTITTAGAETMFFTRKAIAALATELGIFTANTPGYNSLLLTLIEWRDEYGILVGINRDKALEAMSFAAGMKYRAIADTYATMRDSLTTLLARWKK